LLPTAMCDANAIHEERYANHACDAALSGAPAHSIAAASTYHLPLSSSTSTPLPPMLPFQLVDQQADISTTGLPAFLPMDVWPHGLPPSRSNGREPPAAEVTQPPSLSDAQAQASATSASSRVPSSRSASLLPTAEPVPPQTPASSLTAPPPPRRKLPTTDSVEQHRPAEATSGEHGVDRARQVQVPREVDASYVLLLSELAAPHAAAVTAKAAAFASSFVHTSPPAAADASSHPDAVSVRAALAALMALARRLKVTSRAFGGASIRTGAERFLLGLLHAKVLGAGCDNVEDKVLQAQLGTLSFIRASHIGVAASHTDGPHFEEAQACLRRMCAFSSPLDKMACLAACHAHLCTLLDPHDASFIKLLALAMVSCKPPQLHSQLEFALRFTNPESLWDADLGMPLSMARAALQWLQIQDARTYQG